MNWSLQTVRNIPSTILIELVSLVGTTIAVLLMRYLLMLSTPEQDYQWLQAQAWFQYLRRLRFYRGVDFFYQLRFWRMIDGL